MEQVDQDLQKVLKKYRSDGKSRMSSQVRALFSLVWGMLSQR